MEIVPPSEVADITVGTLFIWALFVVGLVTAALKLRRAIIPLLEKIRNFFDDWEGSPERPGVKAEPGVMERLSQLEYQLYPNHGSSMYDKIVRIEGTIARQGKEFALVKRRLSALETKVNALPHPQQQQAHRSKNEENPGVPNA